MVSADPSESGYLRIVDFGLAKFLKPGEVTQTFAGTPDYVSPEVLTNKGHSHPTDWWTVGVLTYEMIVGMPPFYDRK
jgi:serine/threonine protein kinase